MSSLLYRINQRLKYRKAKTRTQQRIIELNLQRPRVIDQGQHWFIPEANAQLPKKGYDLIFDWFDLFIQLPKRLNGQYTNEEGRLFFSFKDLKISITSFSEVFILNEIFYQKCYQVRMPQQEKLIVLDMGMNVGLASLYFASLPQVDKIYAYEPFEPTYKQGLENLALNAKLKQKIEAFNYGLGDSDKQVEVPYNSENSGTNVTLLDKTATGQQGSSITLQIKDAGKELQKIAAQHPGHKILIKLDTEGAEYEIFDALFATQLPENLIGFLMEWHVKGPETLEQRLTSEGFRLVSTVIDANTGLFYAFR